MSSDLTVWLNKFHNYCVCSFCSTLFGRIYEIMQIFIAEYINDVNMNDISAAQTPSSNEGINTRLSSSPPKSFSSCSSLAPVHKKGALYFSLLVLNCSELQFSFCCLLFLVSCIAMQCCSWGVFYPQSPVGRGNII